MEDFVNAVNASEKTSATWLEMALACHLRPSGSIRTPDPSPRQQTAKDQRHINERPGVGPGLSGGPVHDPLSVFICSALYQFVPA
jgi:hypothetical protein